jgi:hypothetical protein
MSALACNLWLGDDQRRICWEVYDRDDVNTMPVASGEAHSSATVTQELLLEGWKLAPRDEWEQNDAIDGYTVAVERAKEHVVLVAMVVRAPDEREAQRILHDRLAGVRDGAQVDSWWVAEDQRFFDDSDNDSAVFVPQGRQGEAVELLEKVGL